MPAADRSDLPDILLASILSDDLESHPKIYLLVGASGSGKTTFLMRLISMGSRMPERGRFAGILSPAVYSNGQKNAIDLLDIASQARRRLAVKAQPDVPGTIVNGAPLGWQLDRETLAWGNGILKSIHDCEILVLDELGPLEWLEGQGLVAGFSLVDQRAYRRACLISMRPSLLELALNRWSEAVVVPIEGGAPDVT